MTLLLAAKAKFLARLPFCTTWQSRVLTASVVFGVPSLAWSYLYTNSNPAGSYFSTFTRAWDLLLGASVALSPLFRAGLSPIVSKALSWLGFGFLTLALVVIGTDTAYPGLIALIPTLGTCMLLIAGVNAEAKTPVYKFLASKPIRWTGKVSYSLYLWHWPIIIFAAAIVPKSEFAGLPRGALLFGISLIAAWASYSLVEVPFMDLKKFKAQHYDRVKKVWNGTPRADAKATAMALGTALSLLTLVAFARPGSGDKFAPPQALEAYANGSALRTTEPATPTTSDQPAISTAQQAKLEAWKKSVTAALNEPKATPAEIRLAEQGKKLSPDPACYGVLDLEKAKTCTLSGGASGKIRWPAGVPKTAVLLGHSIAAQFRESIAKLLPSDVTLTPLTLPGCQLSVRGTDSECGSHNEWAIGTAKKLKPGLMIFSLVLGNSVNDQNSPETRAIGGRLQSIAQRRLFITDAPMVPPFSDCLKGTDVTACRKPTVKDVLTNLGANGQFARQFRMTMFSMASLICVKSQCPPFIDGYPVRFDGQHLTVGMMDRMAPFMASSIQLALENTSG